MAKPPQLECLEQAPEFNRGGAHFPLVVRKTVRPVIGNRIVILAHVSEHAQESFALRLAAFAKGTFLRRPEQRCKQMAVLFDEMVPEIAFCQSAQLPQKVAWQATSRQCTAQRLQFMRSDPSRKSGS